ncbi:caspase domain containing protein [Nitzschia inconspicua]|uniref:Caspase domain containing protein n=1 Tax=Nitzschia inconspicua TaxID=303405 RepID=A0A9K3Q508_9STRA|nr:caspase domain containing protein [Nitzschia inconspicua]
MKERASKESRSKITKKLLATAKDYIAAKVVLFSACQDHQTTAGIDNVRKLCLSFVPEGTKGGACTSLFLQVLYHNYKLQQEYNRRRRDSSDSNHEHLQSKLAHPPPSITYGTILNHMQQVCERNNYTQIPLLSCSRPIHLYKDPFQIVPDNFVQKSPQGTKRALIIGITYTNSPHALAGCQNDCRNVIAFLKKVHSFEDEDITLLLDDPVACDDLNQPTKKNILRTFRTFSMQCQEGDVVFIHYAGHGIAVEARSCDEPDCFQEALLPVDYMTSGEILDVDIFRLLLIPMPKNVLVTALFDCCHSGTILDLPFQYSGANPVCDYDSVVFPHMQMVEDFRDRMRKVKKTQDLQDSKS